MSENQQLRKAVEEASSRWQQAFNSGNAAACAAQYEASAEMQAEPFGTYTGTQEIQAFWQNLIDQGYSDVEYLEPSLKIEDEQSATLASGWQMNKAYGEIIEELWVLQADGTAKLRKDHFQVKGER